MLKECVHLVSELIAHEAPMILIDEVSGYDDENIRVIVKIQERSPFLYNGSVPSYIGVEYMAQTVACFCGLQALNAKESIRIGFLLGTRKLKLSKKSYSLGDMLVVNARALYNDGEMAAFECSISVNNETVSEATLNVYQPSNLETMNGE